MSGQVRLVDTRVWFLELEELRPAAVPDGARIEHAAVPLGAFNRFFYAEIGRDFDWSDKSGWSDAEWDAWAEGLETWVAYDRGTPAGYAELGVHPDRVELHTFGLLAPFRGRGLGGALLTRAAERGRELAAGAGIPVAVQTCSLDGPHALANYRARGFEVVREELQQRPSRRG